MTTAPSPPKFTAEEAITAIRAVPSRPPRLISSIACEAGLYDSTEEATEAELLSLVACLMALNWQSAKPLSKGETNTPIAIHHRTWFEPCGPDPERENLRCGSQAKRRQASREIATAENALWALPPEVESPQRAIEALLAINPAVLQVDCPLTSKEGRPDRKHLQEPLASACMGIHMTPEVESRLGVDWQSVIDLAKAVGVTLWMHDLHPAGEFVSSISAGPAFAGAVTSRWAIPDNRASLDPETNTWANRQMEHEQHQIELAELACVSPSAAVLLASA